VLAGEPRCAGDRAAAAGLAFGQLSVARSKLIVTWPSPVRLLSTEEVFVAVPATKEEPPPPAVAVDAAGTATSPVPPPSPPSPWPRRRRRTRSRRRLPLSSHFLTLAGPLAH
jgi:hypothetical protein